jgi:hypothetical protein
MSYWAVHVCCCIIQIQYNKHYGKGKSKMLRGWRGRNVFLRLGRVLGGWHGKTSFQEKVMQEVISKGEIGTYL